MRRASVSLLRTTGVRTSSVIIPQFKEAVSAVWRRAKRWSSKPPKVRRACRLGTSDRSGRARVADFTRAQPRTGLGLLLFDRAVTRPAEVRKCTIAAGPIRILPLVSTVEELRQAHAICVQVCIDVATAGRPHDDGRRSCSGNSLRPLLAFQELDRPLQPRRMA